MTKKDYIIIANNINAMMWNEQGNKPVQEAILAFVTGLANDLEQDNPRFNRIRFIEACFKK